MIPNTFHEDWSKKRSVKKTVQLMNAIVFTSLGVGVVYLLLNPPVW